MAEARFERHMSDEDALMWNIEKDPILRSTILAVAEFDRTPDWATLRARIERGTRAIPRLRQRVLSPPLRIGPPRWTVDPSFDLDFHLRRVRLPAPGTERVLLDVLQPIASAAFDRARPLWEFTLLEGLVREDGTEGAALAMKVHHSVTDGVGGMALLTELIDFERFAPPPDDTNVPAAPAPEAFDSLALIRDSLGHTTRRFLGIARRVPATVFTTTVVAVRNPAAAGAQLVTTARSVARILAPATAPMSPVMRERGMGRQLAKFTVSIDDVRRAGKSVEGSINDVFLAAVTGGLQRYHAHHGEAPPELRLTMPISLRTSGDGAGGNKFAPARFPVPTDMADPADRVRECGARARQWRAEPALQLTGALAGILNRLPTATTTAIFGSMLKCCDFCATNVPGAPVPVYAAGARVEGLYAFAPPSGAAVNVSLISHIDTCCIGVVLDTTAVPDGDLLVRCLRDGFDEVLALG